MRSQERYAARRFAVNGAVVVLLAGLLVGAAPAPLVGRKHYVGPSPAACETIDYFCPSSARAFHDAQGCGCLYPPDLASSAGPAPKSRHVRHRRRSAHAPRLPRD